MSQKAKENWPSKSNKTDTYKNSKSLGQHALGQNGCVADGALVLKGEVDT